jgi:hypothetical protein
MYSKFTIPEINRQHSRRVNTAENSAWFLHGSRGFLPVISLWRKLVPVFKQVGYCTICMFFGTVVLTICVQSSDHLP